MHDPFGDPLAIEMRHLFKEQEIFKHDGTAGTHGQGILVVTDRTARIDGHVFFLFSDDGLVDHLALVRDR